MKIITKIFMFKLVLGQNCLEDKKKHWVDKVEY
jgi:hypothetical protein